MIRIRQVKVGIEGEKLPKIKEQVAKILRIKASDILHIKIVKESLDARKKEKLHYVYEVDIDVKEEKKILSRIKSPDIFPTPKEEYIFEKTGTTRLKIRPIIVGSGPAGLFCAYLLAEHGYQPLIIERGERVEERVASVEKFWETGVLKKDSNVQFGEGGAGTFSDGKLNTLVKDKNFRGKKILELLVEHGAPKEILYQSKPHIGTDILREVIKNIRNKIISFGGEFRYQTCLTDIQIKDQKITAIEVDKKELIPCQILILAIGHSARDTFWMLLQKKIEMQAKSFAVGVRIEHPQEMINQSQYGTNNHLPPASYKLTYTTKEKRGVYSFCMCPGGYVVNASSEEKRLAINGMSNYKRDTENANSALVVTVTPKDFGNDPLDGMRFQQNLEMLAYQKGLGKIPVQLYQDFKYNKESYQLGKIKPSMKGQYQLANLNDIFPKYITDALKEAIPYFGLKITGFNRKDAVLSGVESRTSSPEKILRDDQGMSNILGLYPCGEGSGYAGGIITAAMDGMKVAEWVARKYIYEGNKKD